MTLVTLPLKCAPTGYLASTPSHGSVEQLLHAERDALGLVVDLDDLDRDRLADIEHLGRVVDAAPGDVGDMQQAVDAAEIHEGAVVGDVLDHAFDDLPSSRFCTSSWRSSARRLFQHGAARHHDIAAAAIHFQDLERLRLVHQRADIADRAHVDLAARQEGHGAVEIDGEAALDPAEDHAVNLLVVR